MVATWGHRKRIVSQAEPRTSKTLWLFSDSHSWDIDVRQTEFPIEEKDSYLELQEQRPTLSICRQWRLAGTWIYLGVTVSMLGTPGSSQALQRQENFMSYAKASSNLTGPPGGPPVWLCSPAFWGQLLGYSTSLTQFNRIHTYLCSSFSCLEIVNPLSAKTWVCFKNWLKFII